MEAQDAHPARRSLRGDLDLAWEQFRHTRKIAQYNVEADSLAFNTNVAASVFAVCCDVVHAVVSVVAFVANCRQSCRE